MNISKQAALEIIEELSKNHFGFSDYSKNTLTEAINALPVIGDAWVSVENLADLEMGEDVICTDNHSCYSIGWYSNPEGFFTDKQMNVTHYKKFNPEYYPPSPTK